MKKINKLIFCFLLVAMSVAMVACKREEPKAGVDEKNYHAEESKNDLPDVKPDDEVKDSDMLEVESNHNEQNESVESEADVVSIYDDLDDATRKVYLDIAKDFVDAIFCDDDEQAVYRVGEVAVKCASLDITGIYPYSPDGVNYQVMEYEYLISGDYSKEFENLIISMTFWNNKDYSVSVSYYKGNGKGQFPVINSYRFEGNVDSVKYGVDNKLVLFDHEAMSFCQYWRYGNGYAGESYNGTASDCREDVREMNKNMALYTDEMIASFRSISMK